MVPFYNAKDQAIYNAGDKFMSQSKYLLNDYVPTEGISYEGDGSPVSYANSGIMTQSPIIYPPIVKQLGNDGGGGGGDFTGPTKVEPQFDYEYDALGGLNNYDNVDLTEEEQAALDAQIAGPQLSRSGALATIAGMMSAPITTMSFHHRRNKKIQKELEEKTRQAGIQADLDRAYSNQSQKSIDQQNQAGVGGGQFDGAETKEQYDAEPTAYSGSFAKGGRVGYFFGGRIGFRGGGMDASSDDFGGGNTPGPGDTGGEGGNNPTDNSNTQFDGGNNDGARDNPPVAVVDNNPVDISTVTKSIGNYDIPYGLEALLENKGRFQAVINPEEILEKNLGVDFTYDKGPYQVGFNADMEGNKNLGISYNKGNLSAYANTDFDNPSLGFKYSRTFANGGLASIL